MDNTKEKEPEQDITLDLERYTKPLKEDFKKIDKQVVVLGIMIFLVCVVFFFLGYYLGSHLSVIECNKVIAENAVPINLIGMAN
jgi:hypothetical protein